jgi:tRNA (pseudouridine54-N1)-methyltransferase
MRNFIIVGHRAVTDSKFSLNDLPSSGGRMDILARCINSAFVISHGIRKEVEVAVLLLGPEEPPKSVRFVGAELKYLNPDERSTGALIRNALVKHSAMKTDSNLDQPKTSGSFKDEINSSPGVFISSTDLKELLKFYSGKSRIVYLIESAPNISVTKIGVDGEDLTFILSDDKNFTDTEEKLIRKYSNAEFSLGPEILHSEHCITIVHNILDLQNKA